MNSATLTLLAPGSLLAGALLQIVVARFCSPRAKGILAFLFCIPALLSVVALIPAVQAGQAIDFQLLPWDGPLAMVVHVDALSILFAFMGTGIGGLVLLYSIGYMAHDESATRFYTAMLVFICGFVGLVFSANLFVFYLFWEVVGLCSFSLVGFWYTNPEAVRGARKVLLMTHIAGYGLLTSIIVIYHRAGTALWTDPRVAHSMSTGLFLLILVALVAKSVQFPLHTWIPEAMAAPTPVSALLHAACYVKAGVYLAARLHSFGAWPFAWSASLIWVATVTMAVGVMYAMVQNDLKRMLAFSTVSQIGYMMLGIGIGTPLAITAGLLHCLNHGFFKGGLFLTAGSVQHACGTRDMNQLGGLASKMPKTMISWLVGAGSMMGIPLMSGFASKWMLYAAALQAGWAIPAMVAWAVSLGTVFLGAKATSAVFLGPETDSTRDAHESPSTMVWGMGFLAAGSILLGVAPQLAVNVFLNPVLGALGLGAGVHVTWLGLSADAGSFSTVGGLVLAVVSIVLGGAIYLVAYTSRSGQPAFASAGAGAGSGAPTDGSLSAGWAGGGIFTGGEPLNEQDRLTAGDFSQIFLQNWASFFKWTNVDRVYLGAWDAIKSVSAAFGILIGWCERHATSLVLAFAAILLLALRWLVPASAAAAEPAVLPSLTLLIAAIALAAVALFVASLAIKTCSCVIPLWVCMAVVPGLAIAGLLTPNPALRITLLESAAAFTVVRVWMAARTQSAKLTYLAVVAVSALTLILSELAQAQGQPQWARALLLTSIIVKLAAVPVFFWLLSLADELPALVLGLIIAVLDMAAFGEFLTAAPEVAGVVGAHSFLIWIAAFTSFLGALLMLSQKSLKRILVLSTVEDVGFLFLGVASATTLGVNGALAAAATHALAKALLFICLASPEADGALGVDAKGLAARYPLSAFGFLFGMLAMLGIPPLMGFIGRWRLYFTAHEIGLCPMAIFILASIAALIAYVLALTRNWWGPPPEDAPQAHEPFAVKSIIVLLVAVLLLAGVWPQAIELLMGVSL
ncbi:MAG: proton-conducting transporter membrane subunit [Terracidiphilus sp.]|nr:proton-conducting transporter membrane subunit [Terracidiphilus sp.]